jgi:hypothetical protein
MNIERNEYMIKITADKDKYITNYSRNLFTQCLCLPTTANVNEFEEVGREIWKYFVKEENPNIVEMQNLIKELTEETFALKEETVRLKDENTFLTELLLENDYRLTQELLSLKSSQK